MFQCPSENEDKDERDGPGSATVVRTESHVARFNTARALFEKMAEKKDDKANKGFTQRRQFVPLQSSRSVGSSCGKAHSRSPSPPVPHPSHQSNGHHCSSCKSNLSSVSTIASISYTSTTPTFHSSAQNPSVPSVLPFKARSSSFDAEALKGKWNNTIPGAETSKSNYSEQLRCKNEYAKNQNDERLAKPQEICCSANRVYHTSTLPAKIEDGSREYINRKYEQSLAKAIENKNKPNLLSKPEKPAKPETLIDKPLSSHLQNQQIIQRHKNWFQSYSKIKSPVTSPQKQHHQSPNSQPACNAPDQRRHSEDPAAIHSDWRRERSAILKGPPPGRSGHQDVEENDGKASVDIANVKNFENASTLPSCWSPPQQYNECSSNKSDISSSFYQDTHPLPSSSSSANEESKRCSSKGERAIEGKTYIITDISKDARITNNEKKNVLASQIDMKNVGVFKKESQLEKSSSPLPQEGERRNKDHHPQDSSHSEEETVSKSNIVLRQRTDLSRDKEKRLKEWEKRLSQREAGFYAVHDVNVDRHTNRDSYISKFEGKHLPEPSYDTKDSIKGVKDSREYYHEDYLHRTYKTVEKDGRHSDRSEKEEDDKERKKLLQTEREKIVREERRTHELDKNIVCSEDQAKLRGKDGKEECKGIHDKKNDKQPQYPRKDKEENLECFLGKRNITEAALKVEKFDERLKTDEKREKSRRDEREREILRREFEERERLLRDVEQQGKFMREEGEHQRPRTKEEEELERLRRHKIERERIKREEEHEKKRRQKEEKERVRRESGEKERPLLEEDREKVRKEDKERDKMIREKEEWMRMKRELEDKERLKKGDKEFEKLMREEEELDRQRKEKRELEKLKREEEERIKLKRKELEKLRREEEERERMKKEEEEKRRLRREIEMEKFRKEEEENERLHREVEEKERQKREEEAREKIKEERIKKKEEERLRKEEEERIRREEEDKRKRDEEERLMKEEEERLRREKEEKMRREEEERFRKEEEERLRREEEEERLRREEVERLRREEIERLRREEEERLRREEEERLRREKEERLRRVEEERLRRLEEERLRRLEEERLRREEEERLRKKEEERLRRKEEERLRREKEDILRREEEERLRREEEKRLRKEEEERLRREEEERLRKEEEERLKREEEERLRREEEERLRREEEERLRREEEEKLRREEEEKLRREEEERLRREEQEKLRREEQERLKREEQVRLRREEQERLRREEEQRLKRAEEERLRREEEERLRIEEEERLRREEEERLKGEEEERLWREEEERLRREEEEKFIRNEERLWREEKESQLRIREEEMRRRKEQEKEDIRKEEESLQKEEHKEVVSLKNVNKNTDVTDESNREVKIVANKEKNAQDHGPISHKDVFERRWQAKREELEEEERVRREKDRFEIEKTKKRIAELKKERDEIQRQQAIRLRMLMTGENDVEEKLADYNEMLSASRKDEELGSPAQNGEETFSLSNDFTTSTPESENLKIESIDSSHSEVTIMKETEAFQLNSTFCVNKSTSSTQLDEDSLEEVTYDHTVQSAQHKIEFCTGTYNESISKDVHNSSSASNFEPFTSSTISSDFEPLPPPVPPHNVDPAILTANHIIEQTPLPPLPPQQTLEVTTELPEPMTPEEAEKLLSHNIIETKKSLITETLEADSSKELNTSEICDSKSDLPEDSVIRSKDDDDDDGFDKDYDSVCVESPTPDNEVDLDDSFSSFKHEVNGEGFVVRAKEVLSEDGIHYLEDGHFWIQVPGLMEEDEDDIPDTVPFHKHTKLKFSQDPIKLYSTFSVTDYDRRNDEVDPVAASAEYELEKRVEKMNVFPVSIDKGDGGLGLSIIGVGVGADAGVEKLGIFVKTINPGGATDRDGRIKVNDQIIEVDNQSLVGVTQMFAASVLKNTSGTVNFLIGRENDPDNSEVAMLIRQSLMADQERDERRRALEGPNYDPRDAGGVFESFSSQSGGESPSDDGPRGSNFVRDLHREPNMYGQEYGDQFGDVYNSCQSLPPRGTSSPTPEAFNHDVEGRELLLQNNEIMIMSQHLQEIQHRNEMYEEEINILRNKICELEKELGNVSEMSKQLQEANARLKEAEDTLKSKQTEISTYQDMLEQSQGQYIILEKKYYKAKKIIKEYQSRERDFLHREEYHITQLEEKDALYNSLVKALKDRVIQLEGDLIKAQQEAGLPVKVPPDLNSQSSNFVHSSKGPDNHSSLQRDPPRKPSTLINCLDPDLSDTEAGDTHTSEGSKSSTVERKIPSKEELDVAVPPTELLDNSFSKAKGELASRGGLANRQLPSLKKSASNASSNSFDNSLDDGLDDTSSESQQQTEIASQSMISTKSSVSSISQNNESVLNISHSQTSISSFTTSSQTSKQENITYNSSRSHPPPPYHSTTSQTATHPPSQHHQPPPYQPPPSAPLSHRPVVSSDSHSSRSEGSYRHPPPVARVQPVNRVEALPSPTSPSSQQQHQQTLAHQLKALLAEREGTNEPVHDVNRDGSPIKKSPSSLMEDVRRAVMQADISIGKKPVISGPIHVSSTAQVVSTGQFVHSRASPQKGVGAAIPQKVSRDSGTWSPVINSSSAGGVVLLSQRPIDSSLPLSQANDVGAGLEKKSGMASSDSNSSFDTQPHQERVLSGRSSKESSIMSVFDWNKEQVAQWLVLQGLENYVATFVNAGITGPRLVNIDTKDLKNLGLSSDDKNKIKRKVKDLRQNLEKERKQIEKENKEREKLQKKAEKLAEKAERRKK